MGYHFNPQFSNDQGACLVISDTIHAMLLTEALLQDLHQEVDRRHPDPAPRS